MSCNSCNGCVVNEAFGIKDMTRCSCNKETEKTNYAHIVSLSVDELAEWIELNGMYDGTPWMEWWNNTYCDKCESVTCTYEDIFDISEPIHELHNTVECAYCEVYDKCRHFPELDDCPSTKEIIRMWLDEKA